jgi:uncharacterized protein YbaP (TraB family)
MTRLRSIIGPCLALALALLPQATGAEAACGGKDLLAELASADPAAHQRVLASAAETANASSILWRVEKAGLPASWLFGTVHLSDPRVANLTPAVTTALGQARKVALEVADLSAPAMGAAMQKALPLILDRSGQGLDKTLSADEFTKVRGVLQKTGLPEQIAGMIRPWLAYMLLSIPTCERERAAAGAGALDARLAEAGNRRGIPVVGLETLDSQLAAMASVPADQQLELLRATLAMIDQREDLMETMVQMYLRRQIGVVWPLNIALAAKHGVGERAFLGFERELLTARNGKMRDALVPMLAEGGVFVGVGALHLIGSGGLVALLREAGYTLTPIE